MEGGFSDGARRGVLVVGLVAEHVAFPVGEYPLDLAGAQGEFEVLTGDGDFRGAEASVVVGPGIVEQFLGWSRMLGGGLPASSPIGAEALWASNFNDSELIGMTTSPTGCSAFTCSRLSELTA